MDKNEILNDLYTIRAGISLISKESDKLTFAENQLNDVSEQLKSVSDELAAVENNDITYNMEYQKYLAYKNQVEKEKLPKKEYFDIIEFFLYGIIGIGILFYLLYAGSVFIASIFVKPSAMLEALNFPATWSMYGMGYLVIALPAAVIIELISTILFTKGKIKKFNAQKQKRIDDAMPVNKNLRNNMDEFGLSITEYKTDYSEDYKRKDSLSLEVQDKKQNFEIVKTTTNIESNAIYKSLYNSYNDIFDYRDWPYVDLAIFALETNRAENIKEALEYIDKQKQTQQIVEAIKIAGEVIATSINNLSRSINRNINAGFDRLNKEIIAINDRFDEHELRFEEQEKLLASQNENISNLRTNMNEGFSHQSYMNALQDKVNMTSYEIMNDVNRMIEEK